MVKGEQSLVDLKNVVLLPGYEIFNDNIKLAAGAQRVTGAGDKVTRLVQIQLQRDGESDGRGLGGLIAGIAAYF